MHNLITHHNQLRDGSIWIYSHDCDLIYIQNIYNSNISYNEGSGSNSYDTLGWSGAVDYWSFASNSLPITNIAKAPTTNLIRVTTSGSLSGQGLSNNGRVWIYNSGNANGLWTFTLISDTVIELQNSNYKYGYSNGTISGCQTLPCTGNVCSNNYFHELAGAGIRFAGGTITDNIVSNYGGFAGLSVGATPDPNDCIIANNTIYNATGALDAISGTCGVRTSNQSGSLNLPTRFYLRNNIISIIYSNGSYTSFDVPAQVTADHNCWYAGAGTIPGTNNVTSNPQFANGGGSYALATDFELTSGSPCKGAGVAISGLTTDYAGIAWGSPPSMGAYEYESGGSLLLGR